MDKFKGLVVGSVLSDAIGLTREFKGKCHLDKIIFPYEHPIREWEKNDWSDDGDQCILLLELMIEKNLNQLSFAKKLFDWKENGFSELGDTSGKGIGGCTLSVIGDGMFLTNPVATAYGVWEGSGFCIAPNGSLMRTAILSYYTDYLRISKEIGEVTHADPRCIAACLALNQGIRLIIIKQFKNLKKNAIRPAIQYLMNQSTFPQTEIRGIPNRWVDTAYYFNHHGKRRYNYPQELIDYLNKSNDLNNLKLSDRTNMGYVYKCLGCALWGFGMVEYYYHENKQLPYIKLIKHIASYGGDADTNAVVVGAIFGTYLGYEQLYDQASKEINAMPHIDWLMKKFDQLTEDKENDITEPIKIEELDKLEEVDYQEVDYQEVDITTILTKTPKEEPTEHEKVERDKFKDFEEQFDDIEDEFEELSREELDGYEDA